MKSGKGLGRIVIKIAEEVAEHTVFQIALDAIKGADSSASGDIKSRPFTLEDEREKITQAIKEFQDPNHQLAIQDLIRILRQDEWKEKVFTKYFTRLFSSTKPKQGQSPLAKELEYIASLGTPTEDIDNGIFDHAERFKYLESASRDLFGSKFNPYYAEQKAKEAVVFVGKKTAELVEQAWNNRDEAVKKATSWRDKLADAIEKSANKGRE